MSLHGCQKLSEPCLGGGGVLCGFTAVANAQPACKIHARASLSLFYRFEPNSLLLPKIKPMISFLIAQWTQNWSMNFLSIKIFELQCHVFPLQPPCSGQHELGSCHLPAEITFSRPLIIPCSCRLPVSFPLSPEKCQALPFSTKKSHYFYLSWNLTLPRLWL